MRLELCSKVTGATSGSSCGLMLAQSRSLLCCAPNQRKVLAVEARVWLHDKSGMLRKKPLLQKVCRWFLLEASPQTLLVAEAIGIGANTATAQFAVVSITFLVVSHVCIEETGQTPQIHPHCIDVCAKKGTHTCTLADARTALPDTPFNLANAFGSSSRIGAGVSLLG